MSDPTSLSEAIARSRSFAVLTSSEGFTVALGSNGQIKTLNATTATLDNVTDVLATLIATLKTKAVI